MPVVFVLAAKIYLLAGLCFALWFVVFAIGRLDPAAQGAYSFRLLLLPGLALLWPYLVVRLLFAQFGTEGH